MSKVLHNPTVEDLKNLIKSSTKISKHQERKNIKELPMPKATYGYDVDKLFISNMVEDVAKYAII